MSQTLSHHGAIKSIPAHDGIKETRLVRPPCGQIRFVRSGWDTKNREIERRGGGEKCVCGGGGGGERCNSRGRERENGGGWSQELSRTQLVPNDGEEGCNGRGREWEKEGGWSR